MSNICEKHGKQLVRVEYERGKTGMECAICAQESKVLLHKLFRGSAPSPVIKRLEGLRDKMNSSPGWQDELTDIIAELLAAAPTLSEAGAPCPKIICLCGSTRFIEQFAIKTWELELEGHIVLGCTLLPHWYCGVRDHFAEKQGVKGQRDEHHLRKIDLADEVLVLNIGGYIGESTRNEIAYAEKTGKPVRYLEPEAGAKEVKK